MGMIVNPFGSFGVGGGPGAVSSRPQVVQNGGKFGTQNFTGAQTYHMPGGNFTAGNDVLVCTNHWHASAIGLSTVVVNGVTATLLHTGVGSTALLQYWLARNVLGTADTVVITPTSGTGHYITANAIEISPIDATTAIDVFAELNATSATPGSTVTTATTTQCEELVYACWRDDTGVVNAAAVTPSGYTLGALETDGVSTQGGAMAYKLVQRLGTQNATFGCTSTLWYETTAALKFKAPCVLSGVIKQDWVADNAWVTTTLAVTISSGDFLVSVGGWWCDTGTHPVPVPTDSAGTFIVGVSPDISTGENPVSAQICYQTTPSAGSHTVTPPSLGIDGDGYFGLIRFPGSLINTSTPIRDTGRARSWHTQHTPPDPSTIQTLSISSSGSSAQVGDYVIIALVMDPNSVSNSDVAFVPPAGWFVLINKFNLTDNIGFIAMVGKVSVAGQISATITWTDPNTFVADASMLVLAHP